MKRVYICNTVYQVLISLLKMDFKKDTLLSVGIVKNFPNLRKELMSYVKLVEVEENLFGLRSILKVREKKEWLLFFRNFDEVIIFLDHRQLGHFLNKHRISYSLMEDGYNFYKDKRVLNLDTLHPSFLKRILYRWYFRPTTLIGSSPYCQSIEVNDLSLVQFDEAYKPFVEVPRKQLFAQASPEKVQALLQIFGVRAIVADGESSQKRLLLLTQPLYWDHHVTEEELLEIYVAGLAPYREDYSIYIKPHPRDGVDYSFLGEDVVILPQGIPFELFEMAGSIRFDIGMTYSSSALDFLNCFDEKVYLKDTFPLLSKNEI
ncbi:TPA: lipooligosaccharide sialyltransferase [Streptococcus suis]|nr:lipooligosaccharide sialyltransferase [Streptococcus suis]HEM4073672.1 lipooligosaccharide sialyltransferase [Streptococcus suis]